MKAIASFLAMFIAISAYAGHLGLDEAVAKTLSSHPDIKRFVLGLQSARSGVDVARSDYLPQVTLNGEYDPRRTYATTQNGVFATQDDYGWSASAVLSQKIWDFSKTTSAIKAQRVQEEISALNLDDAKAFLVYQVKLQYDLLSVQKEAIIVRERDLKTKEELYSQAKSLVEQGLKTNADASRFLSSVYAAKDDLSRAYADFDKARTALSLYIGEQVEADVKLDDNTNSFIPADSDKELLLNISPSLAALKKQVIKNEFIYDSVRASHYGSIDALASYTRQNALNTYNSTFVGLTLKIPLYAGGRIGALAEQAFINKQIAKEEVDSKKLSLQKDFETLLIDQKRLENTIKAKEAQREASSQTLSLIEGRYKEGLSTYIEVLDAASGLLEAKLGLLQAHYEQRSTNHRLNYLQGKIQ